MLYCGKTKKLPNAYVSSLLFISDGHNTNSGQLKIFMKSPQVFPRDLTVLLNESFRLRSERYALLCGKSLESDTLFGRKEFTFLAKWVSSN